MGCLQGQKGYVAAGVEEEKEVEELEERCSQVKSNDDVGDTPHHTMFGGYNQGAPLQNSAPQAWVGALWAGCRKSPFTGDNPPPPP